MARMTPAQRKHAAALQATLPPGEDVWTRALSALTRELDAAQRDATRGMAIAPPPPPAAEPDVKWLLSFVVPVALVNDANARDHWRTSYARHEQIKQTTLAMWLKHSAKVPKSTWQPPNRVKVVVVRHGKKRMDKDGNWSSAKYLIDGLAYGMGIDDGAPHVDWEVSQVVNPRATPQVVVLVGLVVD